MKTLKDFFLPHGLELGQLRLETRLYYLSSLSILSAIELDNFVKGKSDDFSNTQKLTEIIDKYQLKDSDTALTVPHEFPYLTLGKVIRRDSNKKIEWFSELALEMKLLSYELHDIPHSSIQKLAHLRKFLTDFSKELSSERAMWDSYEPNHPYRYDFVAV
ncbi:MAG: hypothetical protein AABX59_03385 [Nanoarchaeota archaeon]